MAGRLYMRVTIVNESSATLRWKRDWTSRDWTNSWLPSRHAVTPPGAQLAWQAEGDSIAGEQAISGVEARCWYEVVGADGQVLGELYVFANCPWIESQYGNSFHVHAPENFQAIYVDADAQKRPDDHSYLNITFRDNAKRAVPGFKPSVNGFRFSNKDWSADLPVMTVGWLWNQLRSRIAGGVLEDLGIAPADDNWLPFTQADQGLCGGMVFAVMDYFSANQLPPAPPDAVFTPPNNEVDPVFRHIRERLRESFDIFGGGHRWLAYSSPLYPNGDEGMTQALGFMRGRAWVSYRDEWPKIRRAIDAGRLAPLGLVQTDSFDIGKNHQVLAYAYEQSAQRVKLWIYDPKYPWIQDPGIPVDDIYLEFDTTDTTHRISVARRNYTSDNTIYAILFSDAYRPQVAPNGRPLPGPAQPKVVRLVAADADSRTVGGETTEEGQTECGDAIKKGHWVIATTQSFVAQVSGLFEPTVAWKLQGNPLPGTSGEIRVHRGELTFDLRFTLAPGGRTLTLASGGGDTYAVAVSISATDTLGNAGADEGAFEVNGHYDGYRPEDIAKMAQCLARNAVMMPPDIWDRMPSPDDPHPNWEEWRASALEDLARLPQVTPVEREAAERYLDFRVAEPAARRLANPAIARARFRQNR